MSSVAPAWEPGLSPGDRGGVVFVRQAEERPPLQIWINFGILAGRSATPAEIERLARVTLEAASGASPPVTVVSVTIVSEERYEIGAQAEASVHQVRIELAADALPEDSASRMELVEGLLEQAHAWALTCVSDRPNSRAGS